MGSPDGSMGLSKTTLNVLTTYFPGASYSGVVAAQRFGYFEELGFEEVNVEWSFGFNPLQVVTSDRFDVVVSTHIDTILGKAQGVPVETVLTTQGNTVQNFAYKEGSDIRSVQDFPGHIMGIQNGPDQKAFTQEIFQNELTEAQRDEIRQVFIGYDIRNLLTDKVDFMTIFPTNADIISLEQTGTANLEFIPMMDFLDVPGNAALTSEKFASDHRDALIEYTRAHARGLIDSLDPDMTDDLAQACVDSLDDAGVGDVFLEGADPLGVEQTALERFRPFRHIDEWDTNGVGWNPPDRVLEAQRLLVNIGFINEPAAQPADVLVTNEFIDEVYDDNGELIWDA